IKARSPVDRQTLVNTVEAAGYSVPDNTVYLLVEGMTCASCVGRVEKALKAVPGVAEATVNLASERAHVRGSVDPNALVAAIAAAGYAAQTINAGATADDAANRRKETERTALKRDLT